jgi:phage baseplate assembly protein W
MISISNLTSNKSGKKFIFSDLNLNFMEQQVSGNRRNSDIVPGNDLVIDYDEEAIKNSIKNILFQRRFLVDLDINLRKYIGSPASINLGESLGEDIKRAISIYETRVSCDKIVVFVNLDQNLYVITMFIKMLNLNKNIRLNANFTQDGSFDFVK